MLVLALVGGGLFFFLRGDDITYAGRDIVEPEKVLSDAESTLDGIVESRNGAANDETACYFVAKNSETTDIEDRLVCGPVLFVDGDDSKPYLTFPLEASSGDGDATLTVAAEPESPEPAELADAALLLRPDGAAPPDGNGGLAIPEPPRAEADITQLVEPDDLDLTSAETYVGGLAASFFLVGYGEADRFGQGDDARRPAEGQRFVAFTLESAPPEGASGETTSLSITYDDESLELPSELDLGGTAVASVPEDAEDVTLTITEGSLVQTVSLTDGEPGEGNVAVWQRVNRRAEINGTATVVGNLTFPGEGTVPTIPLTVVIPVVSLDYAVGSATASGPDRALLLLDGLRIDSAAGATPCSASCFSLSLPDGSAVAAQDAGFGLIVFDVPADFTEGTVLINGSYTDPAGAVLDLQATGGVIAVAIPAG